MTGSSPDEALNHPLNQPSFSIRNSLKKLARLRDRRKQASMANKPQVKQQVFVVGSPSPRSPYLRIEHVSDTCELDDARLEGDCEADVLVHSGNICRYHFSNQFFRTSEFLNHVKAVNDYFSQMPHRYKIFVPGPHEALFESQTRERMQSLLTNCIYLQDSSCIIEGVTFYGTPWHHSRRPTVGRGFSRSAAELKTAWSNIPDNVDVLVSHSLPPSCLHEELVSRVRPNLLLFGSRSERTISSSSSSCSSSSSSGSSSGSSKSDPAESGVKFKDNIIFSNGHPRCRRRSLFDFYADANAAKDTKLPCQPIQPNAESLRTLATGGRQSLLSCLFS